MTTSILNLDGTEVTNFSDPDRKVMWSKHDVYGDRVYGSLRTIAHLDQTSKQAEHHFGHEIEVLQGAYNTDVEASAGTHDKDACLDIFIPGVDWTEAQTFLRYRGWAAWYRYPPLFGSHIHMISLGYSTPVGVFVPGQVEDYYAHRTGLTGHLPDKTEHPDDIDSTIFDFAEWEQEMESNMPLNAEDKKWIKDTVDARVDTLQTRVNEINTSTRERDQRQQENILDAIESATTDAARAQQIKNLRVLIRAQSAPAPTVEDVTP
jgi:hypothetical protein